MVASRAPVVFGLLSLNSCLDLLAVYAEEMMGGFLHESGLLSSEFSAGAEEPVTGIPQVPGSVSSVSGEPSALSF